MKIVGIIALTFSVTAIACESSQLLLRWIGEDKQVFAEHIKSSIWHDYVYDIIEKEYRLEHVVMHDSGYKLTTIVAVGPEAEKLFLEARERFSRQPKLPL